MLKHVEMDAGLPLQKQVLDTVDEPVILINLFNVDPKDTEAFKASWGKDAAFFKAQPGYISAQLHQGIADRRIGGEAVDHFDHLHQRHRIEEMPAGDARRMPRRASSRTTM